MFGSIFEGTSHLVAMVCESASLLLAKPGWTGRLEDTLQKPQGFLQFPLCCSEEGNMAVRDAQGSLYLVI